MNRRGFLGFLGAAIAGASLDPERLLWKPGEKLISIPRPMLGSEPGTISYWSGGDLAYNVGDILTIEGMYAINPPTGTPISLQRFTVISLDSGGPILSYGG